MEVITRKEMLRKMNEKDDRGNPIPFSFSYITWNANSKTGGAERHYDNAELATSSGNTEKAYQKTTNRTNNHSENSTRNIFVGDKHPKTFHVNAIVRFNNIKVVY